MGKGAKHWQITFNTQKEIEEAYAAVKPLAARQRMLHFFDGDVEAMNARIAEAAADDLLHQKERAAEVEQFWAGDTEGWGDTRKKVVAIRARMLNGG